MVLITLSMMVLRSSGRTVRMLITWREKEAGSRVRARARSRVRARARARVRARAGVRG